MIGLKKSFLVGEERNIPANVGLCRCEKMGVECLAKSVRGLRRPRQIRDAGQYVFVLRFGVMGGY